MRVTRYHELHAGMLGGHARGVGEIEPVGLRIYLERAPLLARHAQYLAQVEFAGFPMSDQAAARMTDHVDVWIANRLDLPPRHLARILLQLVVDGGDHPIELGQHVIGQVEASIVENVYLDAAK